MDAGAVQSLLTGILRTVGLVMAGGGAIYGVFGAVELFTSLKSRDGGGQRDGGMQMLGGVGIAAVGALMAGLAGSIHIV